MDHAFITILLPAFPTVVKMTRGVSPTGRTDSCYLRARLVLLDTSFLPAPLKTVADSEGSHDMQAIVSGQMETIAGTQGCAAPKKGDI